MTPNESSIPAEVISRNSSDNLPTGLPDPPARRALRKRRSFKDALARYFVSIGGLNVILALGLIFVFLFAELIPVFAPAEIDEQARYATPGVPSENGADSADTLLLDLDRYEEIGLRYTRDGAVVFFEPVSGTMVDTQRLPLREQQRITSVAHGEPRSNLVALGLSDGQVLIVRHDYELHYTEDTRTISPRLTYPFGNTPQALHAEGAPLAFVAVQHGTDGTAVAAVTQDQQLLLALFRARVSFMTGDITTEKQVYALGAAPGGVTGLLISSNWHNLFLADDNGWLHYYDISQPAQARRVQSLKIVPDHTVHITALDFLLGTVSIVAGRSDGSLSQYFLVRDERNRHSLTHIRDFIAHGAAITSLATEYTRKGFAAGDAAGGIGLHYPTSARTLLHQPVAAAAITRLAFSPTNSGLLAHTDAGSLHYLAVSNPHPEVSLSALWQKVWYEGRAEPTYVWQSSSASDEFEPKFSQMPLTLGTLKASFYAMLLAMPLAILGAIYAAYFMSPGLRAVVKPSIEVMEALPTVILGFLAGLWLAPFVENNLPAVFSIIVLMPVSMLLLALLWIKLPEGLRRRVPPGWEAALLVPGLLAVGWGCVVLSPYIEIWFFNGSARQWLTEVGISYDQRNALVVGLAMGFAVIPTIFSIAEDAVFSVPRHLTQGSLALGATPWQTVMRVVLLTASPGIFSAIMIGFGRAVGETMIVLMATGNSPIMNFNIFEGMRTLSANIAVELPETAVGSTHYRILFLAALLLFALTFVVNTAAELVRQHLRKKYSSL